MWTKYIKSIVFTRIKTEGTAKLQKQFPNIYFTTSDKVSTNPKFPTVYLQKMQGQPRGRTLEDTKVNAILSSFQIEVVTNTNQTDAEIIADVMADIMIDMGFDMVGEPFPDNDFDTYRNISRWQRLIGYNDKLNF